MSCGCRLIHPAGIIESVLIGSAGIATSGARVLNGLSDQRTPVIVTATPREFDRFPVNAAPVK